MADTLSDPARSEIAVDTFGVAPEVYDRRWVILGVMNVCLVVVVTAVSSLNVAIPALQGLLNATGADLQWIIDSYALVFAGLLLPAGALGDRFGRKKMLVAGLIVFTVSAFLASRATDPTHLIAIRCAMGVGAALIMPATLSIIVSSFPMHERPKAISIWAAFAGVGGALGPITSGILLEHFWPGSVFFINIPVLLLLIVAVVLIVPDSRNPNSHPLDPGGALLSIVALVSLVYGVIEGPEHGWLSASTLGAFALAIVGGVAFISYERRVREPMLDPSLFRLRGFSAGSVSVTAMFLGMFGMFFLLTQYLQFVKEYSPLQAGVRIVPSAAALILVAPQGPKLMARFGVKATLRTGFLLMATGFVLMGFSSRETPYLLIGLGLVFAGSGAALVAPGSSQHIVGSVPLSKAGVGSAMNDVTREVGGALGIAIAGSIAATVYRGRTGFINVLTEATDRTEAHSSIGEAFQAGGRASNAGQLDTASLSNFLHSAGDSFAAGTRVAFLSFAGLFVLISFGISHFIPDQLPQREIPDRSVVEV
jgi:EmrB/QacA subfamily drug resistance transporter